MPPLLIHTIKGLKLLEARNRHRNLSVGETEDYYDKPSVHKISSKLILPVDLTRAYCYVACDITINLAC